MNLLDIDPIDDAPDAWHPLDLLVAPLYDDEGDLRGPLAVDLPINGRRPGEAQRAVLNKYAAQAVAPSWSRSSERASPRGCGWLTRHVGSCGGPRPAEPGPGRR